MENPKRTEGTLTSDPTNFENNRQTSKGSNLGIFKAKGKPRTQPKLIRNIIYVSDIA